MSKNKNDDFLSKFADRVEKVGRDGVMGLMKSTGSPINNVRQNYYGGLDYQSSLRNNDGNEIHKNILEYDNSPLNNQNNLYRNNNTFNFRKRKNIDFQNENNINDNYKFNSEASNFQSIKNNLYNPENSYKNINSNNNNEFKNSLLYSNNNNFKNNTYNNNNNFYSRRNVRNNSINYRYNNNNYNLFEPQTNNNISQRNIYSVANNRQNVVDYGYTPYTLNDYKKITNDVKLGKLGPNIGTEEWNQKRQKMKKMSEYGNRVIHEGKGCYVKLHESADERHKRLQEMKSLNGKWNIINEYSKNLALNKDRKSNEQFKRNVNEKLMEEERLVDQQFQFDMEKEKEEERILQQQKNELYQQRLNKMKNLLFK